MEYVMVDDCGFFQIFYSLSEMYKSIEREDEVMYVLNKQGKVYNVLVDEGSSFHLVARKSVGSGEELAGPWGAYLEKWPCHSPLRRNASSGSELIKDIFQVLSLTDSRFGPTGWRLTVDGDASLVKNIKSVIRLCRNLTPENLQNTIVVDPYGRVYRPIKYSRRKIWARSCIILEEF